jgi:hypothetical protein
MSAVTALAVLATAKSDMLARHAAELQALTDAHAAEAAALDEATSFVEAQIQPVTTSALTLSDGHAAEAGAAAPSDPAAVPADPLPSAAPTPASA